MPKRCNMNIFRLKKTALIFSDCKGKVFRIIYQNKIKMGANRGLQK